MAQLGQALCDGQENWLSSASGAAPFGNGSTNQQNSAILKVAFKTNPVRLALSHSALRCRQRLNHSTSAATPRTGGIYAISWGIGISGLGSNRPAVGHGPGAAWGKRSQRHRAPVS